jgi:hypothetical protein
MMAQINTEREAEKRVLRMATFEDGILEITLGLFFALMSVYSLTRLILGPAVNAALVLGVLLILFGTAWLAKRSITLPRIGVVRFGAGTKKKIKTAHVITWVLVIASFAVMVLASRQMVDESGWKRLPGWVRDFGIDLIFAVIIMAIFSLVAQALGAPRFTLYGLLLGVGNLVSTVLWASQGVIFQWPNTLAGGVIVVSGVMVLVKFIQTYALPNEADHD